MFIIENPTNNPYFNIATEEYILNNFNEDCFLLYINKPCIIVGKHQNTLSQININFVKEHSIPVVRRMTGGGTVFHDLGNLNFSFIMERQDDTDSGFKKYTQPIIDVLQAMGIPAILEGRNDLTIEGKKFSGNAKLLSHNKLLQHGTILFNSHIESLTEALIVNPAKFTGKGVQSVRSRVTNIANYLKDPLSIHEFKDRIIEHITHLYCDSHIYHYSQKDLEAIEALVKQKYETWDWDFGVSPNYSFNKTTRITAGTFEVHLDVVSGIIQKCRIFGDFFTNEDISLIEKAVLSCTHSESDIKSALSAYSVSQYFQNTTIDEFISCFF